MVSALHPRAAALGCDRFHPCTALSNPVSTDNQAALPILKSSTLQAIMGRRRRAGPTRCCC